MGTFRHFIVTQAKDHQIPHLLRTSKLASQIEAAQLQLAISKSKVDSCSTTIGGGSSGRSCQLPIVVEN